MNRYSYERTHMNDSLKNIDDTTLIDLADLFKVFADSTRMRIMYRLLAGKMNVGDIAQALEMSQSAISHQLKYLKEVNLVKSKRDGKSMLYYLSDDHVKTIIQTGLEHIEE